MMLILAFFLMLSNTESANHITYLYFLFLLSLTTFLINRNDLGYLVLL
jgi:hypothetical protein